MLFNLVSPCKTISYFEKKKKRQEYICFLICENVMFVGIHLKKCWIGKIPASAYGPFLCSEIRDLLHNLIFCIRLW